jgi:hypothetical protein
MVLADNYLGLWAGALLDIFGQASERSLRGSFGQTGF